MVKPKTGIDLVYIPSFAKSLHNAGQIFKNKIFLDSELKNSNEPTHLAGVFAAKEAVIKALSLPVGSWLQIKIQNKKNGKPQVKVKGISIINSDLSISHSGEYATAIFIVTK